MSFARSSLIRHPARDAVSICFIIAHLLSKCKRIMRFYKILLNVYSLFLLFIHFTIRTIVMTVTTANRRKKSRELEGKIPPDA